MYRISRHRKYLRTAMQNKATATRQMQARKTSKPTQQTVADTRASIDMVAGTHAHTHHNCKQLYHKAR
jgi:hypothetical protein